MGNEFEKLFKLYQGLDEREKEDAIIDFLKNNIAAMQKMHKDFGGFMPYYDLNNINNAIPDDRLDMIYKLLHILTEQIETMSTKVADDFFE